jgi:hypothetical protein
MLISDSITTVNLPVLSEKYTENLYEFKQMFLSNFNKIYVVILGAGFFAIYWAREVFYILVGGSKYDFSLPFVLPLVFAFIFYSFINIIQSSIVIPAKKVLVMISSFVIMIGVTVVGYLLTRNVWDPLMAMSYFVALGSFSGLLFMSFVSSFTLELGILNWKHLVLFIQVLAMSLSYMVTGLGLKAVLFVVFVWLYWWAVSQTGFLTREHIGIFKRMVISKLGKLGTKLRKVEETIS